MYYNEELGREQSTAEVACGVILLAVAFVATYTFLTRASE